jgi:ATP-dependent DNA helicase RecG
MVSLQTNIRSLGGIYKRYATSLEKLGIINFGDFLYHIPFRYEDYSLVSKISDIQAGETVTIRGEVMEVKNQYTRRHFTLQKAKIKDETGTINILWFNQPYITRAILEGDFISLSGKVEEKMGKLELVSPDFEIGKTNFIHTGRLVPIYPETRGISSKWIRRQVFKILSENKNELTDFMPSEILERNNLNSLYESLYDVHFPEKFENVVSGKKRLSFDELFLIQASSILRKEEWQKNPLRL